VVRSRARAASGAAKPGAAKPGAGRQGAGKPSAGKPGAGKRGAGKPGVPAEPRTDGAARAPDEPEEASPAAPERHPLVRAGVYAWALVGIGLAALGTLYVVGLLRLVVVPLVLALFPAALLNPLQTRLTRAKVPPAVAALLVLLGVLGLLTAIVAILVPQVADEIPALAESVQTGLDQLQRFLDEGPLGIDPVVVQDTIGNLQTTIAESDILRTGVLGAAGALAEMTTMLLLLLVVLFFYLKDGDRIAAWLRSLFPRGARSDVSAIASAGWTTVGSYFRGQLFVAFVDGVFIGFGIYLIGVPLALPLGVLVFFGGLFPIVGAVVTGAVAVLVALASGGITLALMTLAIVIAVQQFESNVLAPLVLGKATAMHPLAVITALTIGGILLGMLGAFLAVPVAASLTRGIGHLREQHV
jgi:putative heme transporter